MKEVHPEERVIDIIAENGPKKAYNATLIVLNLKPGAI